MIIIIEYMNVDECCHCDFLFVIIMNFWTPFLERCHGLPFSNGALAPACICFALRRCSLREAWWMWPQRAAWNTAGRTTVPLLAARQTESAVFLSTDQQRIYHELSTNGRYLRNTWISLDEFKRTLWWTIWILGCTSISGIPSRSHLKLQKTWWLKSKAYSWSW